MFSEVQSPLQAENNPLDETDIKFLTKNALAMQAIMETMNNAGTLNFPQGTPFTPDMSVVRTCIYWSLALILSISTARLAVAMRGFLPILRSSHTQVYEKLTDLRSKWMKAERYSGPTIDRLPFYLVVPVTLFLIGLFDTLLSAALPYTQSTVPILIAGIVSCVCSVAVVLYGVYIIKQDSFSTWTPSLKHVFMTQPDNSEDDTNEFLCLHGGASFVHFRPFIALQNAIAWIRLRIPPFIQRADRTEKTQPVDVQTALVLRRPLLDEKANQRNNHVSLPMQFEAEISFLSPVHHAIYHAVIRTTHDDELLDHASAAFLSLIMNRLQSERQRSHEGPQSERKVEFLATDDERFKL
ncbi:hypothetical protein H0H92_009750 [Tricholoma furcatifolium]|nr:hypothetical protein H0H92_009750 [Tricholoma furcatifolium]